MNSPIHQLTNSPTSYSSRVGRPDEFVQLQLQSSGQVIREDPLRERLRIEYTVDGRHQNRCRTMREIVAGDDVARERVVGAVLDDELDLVVRSEPVEIAPVVLAGLAAGGALHVDDLQHRIG